MTSGDLIVSIIRRERRDTNGAEARVVGWKCRPLDDTGKMQLETVFVELIAPPTPIQLEGLPLNVIPIYKVQTKVKCMMLNGKVLSTRVRWAKALCA